MLLPILQGMEVSVPKTISPIKKESVVGGHSLSLQNIFESMICVLGLHRMLFFHQSTDLLSEIRTMRI